VGIAYSTAITVTGGTRPFLWSVVSGALPPGIQLRDGVLSGTPTAPGSSSFTVQVADTATPARLATRQLSLSIGSRVLRVGPARAYQTIQAAIDAADEGLLVRVDPGTYPAFVLSKELTIISDQPNLGYRVEQTAIAPAITIRNLAAGKVAAVFDANVDVDFSSAFAVEIDGNDGTVILNRLVVTTVHDLGLAAPSLVEVRDSASVWIRNSAVVGTHEAMTPTRLPGPMATNDGVSAIRFLNSGGVVQRVTARGCDNPRGAHAGDGVRFADSDLYVAGETFSMVPALRNTLIGGDNGDTGGAAIHMVESAPGDSVGEGLGELLSVPGSGLVTPGFEFAINNDFNSGPIIPALPFGLAPDAALVTLDDDRYPIGSTTGTATLVTVLGTQRPYVFYEGEPKYNGPAQGVAGRQLFAQGTGVILSQGNTGTFGGFTQALNIPNDRGLIGRVVVIQATVAPVPGGIGNPAAYSVAGFYVVTD
jgi:hypothetical protein